MTQPTALMCTQALVDEYGERLTHVAPDIDRLIVTEDGSMPIPELNHVTIAFLSNDTYPSQFSNFLDSAARAPNLQWLQSFSAGVDSARFDAFRKHRVRLTTGAGASAPAMAETVMLFLLALGHDLRSSQRAQAARDWKFFRWNELRGSKLSILGYGPVGRAVAELSLAFHMEPTVVRRAVRGDEVCETRTFGELQDALSQCDATVVALPANDDTRGLLSHEMLRTMPRGSVLVNVSRGSLVDQDALIAALQDGHLGAAALDVLDPEPPAQDCPLWDMPNVILTPHNSGASKQSPARVVDIFFDNLARWQAGKPLINQIPDGRE